MQSVYIISIDWKAELLLWITHRIMQSFPDLHLTGSLSIEGPKEINNAIRYTKASSMDVRQNTIETLFDSTYGIFYTDINSESILSIHEVRAQFPNIKVFKVIGQKPSYGRWLDDTNFSYKEVSLNRFKQETGIAIEDYILSELLVQDNNSIFEDGLYIDLNNKTYGQIAVLNNSASEHYGNKTVMNYGEAYVPYLPFLGRYYDKQIVVKRIAFVTDKDRTVNFKIYFVNRTPKVLVILFHARREFSSEHMAYQLIYYTDGVGISFQAKTPLTVLKVRALEPTTTNLIDMINWEF